MLPSSKIRDLNDRNPFRASAQLRASCEPTISDLSSVPDFSLAIEEEVFSFLLYRHAMRQIIPPVSPKLMFEATKASAEDRTVDPHIAVVAACVGRYGPEELVAAMQRLQALANLLHAKHGEEWTIRVKGEDYTLLHQALLRAAARAPLEIDSEQLMGDVMFDPPTFLSIALAESDAEGSA